MEKGEERKIIIAESHGEKKDPNCVFPFQIELDTRKSL